MTKSRAVSTPDPRPATPKAPIALLSEGALARRRLTAGVKRAARELGFDRVGVTGTEPFSEAERAFHRRLQDGCLDGLDWLTEDRARLACRPGERLTWARSIVSIAVGYYPGDHPALQPPTAGRVARYAWGNDYHGVLKTRLRGLATTISELTGEATRAAVYVDDSPLAEREAARRAGVGWFGKSANLLLPGEGSWFLLGEVLTAAELEPDAPVAKTCGNCTRCVDACPTGAIVADRVVDARRCISYLTIEHHGSIPIELRSAVGTWLFGCDACQEVCPVNRHAPSAVRHQADLRFPAGLVDLHELLRLDEAAFRQRYRGTPFFHAKRFRLQRNACVVLGNLRRAASVPVLTVALEHHDLPLVRSHAAWALGQIGGPDARAGLRRARERESIASVRQEIDHALGFSIALPASEDESRTQRQIAKDWSD